MATRKRKAVAKPKHKPPAPAKPKTGAKPKRKPGATAKAKAKPKASTQLATNGSMPSTGDVHGATGWLLAVASAYGPEGELGKLTTKFVQAAVDASEKLRKHVQQLHRNTLQANVIADWLKENAARTDAPDQLRRMIQSFTGQTFKPQQAKALLQSAKGAGAKSKSKSKAKAPHDTSALRAVAKMLGLPERAANGVDKGQPRASGWSLPALPAWLGYAEPLRDENARRAVLKLVIIDLLRYPSGDYQKVLDVLGLTPDEAEARLPANASA